MNSLPQTILSRAELLPEGCVLSPKEFLHLGSRAAIDQAFSRLTKGGKLVRVARGWYAAPVTSRFGTRVPSPAKVAHSLAKRNGETLVPHGASAANMLGLTRQVPIREVYLSSGRSRKYTLGKSEVLVRHAPKWMMALGQRPAGNAVRALEWMGKENAPEALSSLRKTLQESEWQELCQARSTLPGWMAKLIGEFADRV